METMFIAKEFFNKTIKSSCLETRSENLYCNLNNRQNYIFNDGINGIEKSDFILFVGANPRYEATILNARIRKAYLNNKVKVYSLGDIGDQTYPYKNIGENTEVIKNIVDNKIPLSQEIIDAKFPLIIIGQSALKLKSSKYIFESFKKFLIDKSKISNDWKSLNILSNNASTVGGYDLNIPTSFDENKVLNDLNKGLFELVFLFGQDNLDFNKKNEFVIYIGSHGDKGAQCADIILPSAAYTEQDGYFTNLEGKIQKAYKASYPPGNAKEDWEIINDLSSFIKRKKIYQNKEELIDSMKNYLSLNSKETNDEILNVEFDNEKLIFDNIDYYYSNVIARASHTMTQCRNEKLKMKKTGTEG